MATKKTSDGTVDKRTKEGKAIAERMAKARAAAAKKKKTASTKKSAIEISVTGNKKIGTLMKEFNKKFPYIRINLFPMESQKIASTGGFMTQIDANKTISQVRSKVNPSGITITGNKKIKTLEKEFLDIFGLFAQICFTDKGGTRYYTMGGLDEYTLSAFNDKCEADGCKKNVWE